MSRTDAILKRLTALYPKFMDLDVGRELRLLDALGRPQDRLPPVIHVAGTNAKGSTIAYLRAFLEAAGRRVHVYTSPHLVRFNERIRLAGKLVSTLGVGARVETHMDRRRALEGADFVIVAFQIGGYEPCTVTDFEVPKRYGLRQTIADTLGIGGIMRGLRTVPHLWAICEDMLAVCPQAILLQYVNPMAINTWAIAERYPAIRQVGLCHSVQGTAWELARDLDIPVSEIRYRAAGINHMAFYLNFEHRQPDGSYKNLYPDLVRAYREGRTKSEALREAQLDLIGRGGGFADPGIWAAFTLLGAWR